MVKVLQESRNTWDALETNYALNCVLQKCVCLSISSPCDCAVLGPFKKWLRNPWNNYIDIIFLSIAVISLSFSLIFLSLCLPLSLTNLSYI